VLRHGNNVEVSSKNNQKSIMTGTIKTLVEGKNFGFISREGEEKDLFFHSKELVDVTFEELRAGDVVSFEVIETEKGPAAVKVTRA
jgi:CspA family cold shock protein